MNTSEVPNKLRRWFWRWVAKRSPRAPAVTLRHSTIYIVPSLQGLGFLLVIALLWLLGTNYENNLILATAFLLLSLLVVSVLHAFRNLSGLTLSVHRTRPAFAGEYAEFDLLLHAAAGTRHENIHLCWDKNLVVEADLIDAAECELTLSLKTEQRGWLVPGRLRVSSEYPLGLVRVWSWVALDTRALVYPAPLALGELPLTGVSDPRDGDRRSHDNREDFQGFLSYQPGAPLAHIAWKHYARGAGLHLKDYVGYQSRQVWLDWHSLAGLDTEQRLSRLCYWVQTLARTTTEYGVLLPGERIPLGTGAAHQARALRALALFGLPEHDANRGAE